MKISHAIILSIFGHGILLMSWPHMANFAVASTSPSYQITLLESVDKKIANNIIDKPKSQKTKLSKPEKSKASLNKTKPTLETESKTKKSTNDVNIKAYVISRINHKIRKNFKYPQLARRNGWEGKVMLSLIVDANGAIENAHIKSGSGYSVLDQAALNALLKVKDVQKTVDWFNINHQEIIIPVIYQLQKG